MINFRRSNGLACPFRPYWWIARQWWNHHFEGIIILWGSYYRKAWQPIHIRLMHWLALKHPTFAAKMLWRTKQITVGIHLSIFKCYSNRVCSAMAIIFPLNWISPMHTSVNGVTFDSKHSYSPFFLEGWTGWTELSSGEHQCFIQHSMPIHLVDMMLLCRVSLRAAIPIVGLFVDNRMDHTAFSAFYHSSCRYRMPRHGRQTKRTNHRIIYRIEYRWVSATLSELKL